MLVSALASLVILSVIVAGCLSFHEDTSASDSTEEKNIIAIVLGEGETADLLCNEFDRCVKAVYHVNDVEQLHFLLEPEFCKCIVIANSWISDNTNKAPELVNNLYNDGQLVMVHGGSLDWKRTGLSCSYSEDDVFTAILKYKDSIKTYGVVCESLSDAVEKATEWADKAISGELEYTFQLGEEIDAYLDFESQGYGWTYART